MSDTIMDERTILIVDDEPDILRVLASGLAVLGFSVISVSNGSDAIISAIEDQPDLVILDVMMPGMDGGEVARKLKELPETKDIPVIFLTGMFPKRNPKQDFHMVNGNIMLDKPYEIGELFIAIKKLMGESVAV
jgi:CheY-like chemotaxis protein